MPITVLTPINQCYVLANVPLDNTYRDTMDFADASAQSAYFISKSKYKFDNLTPIRLQNSIRLPIVADDLYLCNYIMFKNRNHGNKWFYAFITKVDYININMCEVFFDIDVMQTWQFNIELHQSYIEREHSATNEIDSNLIEDFYIGDTIVEQPTTPPQISGNTQIIVMYAKDYDTSGDLIVSGTPTGCNYRSFVNDSLGREAFKQFLSVMASDNQLGSVVSIFLAPKEFTFASTPELAGHISFSVDKKQSSLGTYIPRNKKLYTFPYNYLLITNGGTENQYYQYEYFKLNDCTFTIDYTITPNTTGLIIPTNYNKLVKDYNKPLTLGAYPQVAFSNDAYASWIAQNQVSQAVKGVSSIIGIGAGIATENPAAIVGGVMGIVNTAEAQYKASKMPNSVQGHTDNNVLVADKAQKIYAYQCHVREDYARIIDDYFTQYGYAVRQCRIPNTKSRPYWNYIKTQNACITGNIPFNDLSKIKSIYNNGVTFWHDDNVGAYGRSNEP